MKILKYLSLLFLLFLLAFVVFVVTQPATYEITKQKEINLLPKMGFKQSLKITYLHYKFFIKKEPKLL